MTLLIWSFVRSLIGASDGPITDPRKTPGIHTLNPLLPASYWRSARIYPSLCITGRMTAACSWAKPIIITLCSHAFQPRPRRFPALRKHVRERRLGLRGRGADERRALAVFGALQPGVRELGLQLHQPRGQVRLSAAESQEASERLHHLD